MERFPALMHMGRRYKAQTVHVFLYIIKVIQFKFVAWYRSLETLRAFHPVAFVKRICIDAAIGLAIIGAFIAFMVFII